MGEFYAHLSLWLIGMFGIIGVFIYALARFIGSDSWDHDEQFVWRRKMRE
ncbi:hypothetical protein [Paenibacillus sp. HB172176]|nr:hypothetical protein [Paenibacillus sp. HB172176]